MQTYKDSLLTLLFESRQLPESHWHCCLSAELGTIQTYTLMEQSCRTWQCGWFCCAAEALIPFMVQLVKTLWVAISLLCSQKVWGPDSWFTTCRMGCLTTLWVIQRKNESGCIILITTVTFQGNKQLFKYDMICNIKLILESTNTDIESDPVRFSGCSAALHLDHMD